MTMESNLRTIMTELDVPVKIDDRGRVTVTERQTYADQVNFRETEDHALSASGHFEDSGYAPPTRGPRYHQRPGGFGRKPHPGWTGRANRGFGGSKGWRGPGGRGFSGGSRGRGGQYGRGDTHTDKYQDPGWSHAPRGRGPRLSSTPSGASRYEAEDQID